MTSTTSLNNPGQDLNEISLTDLNSIGALAEEVLAEKFNPGFAREFFLDIMKDYNKSYSKMIDVWTPESNDAEAVDTNDYYNDWLNLDLVLWTSIGSGFIALRDRGIYTSGEALEKDLSGINEVFSNGMQSGFNKSMESLNDSFNRFANKMKN